MDRVPNCLSRDTLYANLLTRVVLRVMLLQTLWAWALPSAMAKTEGPSTVPFRYVKGFAVIVPVFINGSGPYDFLLDTGSTCTAVDRELGQSLKLDLKGEGTVTTLVRSIAISVAVAHTVKIGPITESQVELLVRDFAGLREVDPALRGILGQNALNRADYLLDYQHMSIQFDPDGVLLRSLTGERIPLIRSQAADNPAYWLLGVRLTVADGVVRERTLVLDSGAASLVLFADQPALKSSSLQSAVQDDGGMRQLVGLRTVQLNVGRFNWRLPAQAIALRGAGSDLSGLLPMALFPRLYVSNSGSFVLFDPKGVTLGKGRTVRRLFASER